MSGPGPTYLLLAEKGVYLPTTTKKMFLRRYTDLPAVIHMLQHRSLTLLDPETWDDKNDSRYLSLYKEKAGLKSILALCFTTNSETYHHWKIFAPGPAGVCVVFDRTALKSVVAAEPDAILRKVKYIKLVDHRTSPLRKIELLSSKRYAFQHESEERILFRSRDKDVKFHHLNFPLSAIDYISLSPWIHPSLAPGVRELLHKIPGCGSVRVSRSTLIGNDEWQQLGEAAGT